MKKNSKKIKIRTHGGLGNQLFQLYYGILLSDLKVERINLIHDSEYRHGFKISEKLSHLQRSNWIDRIISSLRIGKIIEKITSGRVAAIPIINNYYDGYFQKISVYRNFDHKKMVAAVSILKELFDIQPEFKTGQEIFHLRLGDFFSEDWDKKNYIQERIIKMPRNASIITNEENLVIDQINILERNDLIIVKSEGKKDYEILREIAKYGIIHSNNSTIALWASIMGGGILNITDNNLKEFYNSVI